MKTLFSICLTVAASLQVSTANAPDDAKEIQGNWKPVSGALGGAMMSAGILKTISMKLENGRYDVEVAGEPDKGTYTMDAKTKPKGITVLGTDGVNKGKTFPAIYELKGDTLTICYDLSGAKRPTEFKSTAGTKLYLVTYIRQKK